MSDKVRFIRREEVLDRVGLSKSTVYAMISRKEFPAPKKIGTNSVWVEDEITAWQRKVMAES